AGYRVGLTPDLHDTVTLTLCGDRRGRTPMHRISLFVYDDEGREAVERLGLSVRPARKGSRGWRYESCFKDAGETLAVADRIAGALITHNSIYGFRGADIRNILEFQDEFSDAAVIRLEQNYRSTQTILDAANAVISHNRGRMGKKLWTDVGRGDPVKVREL